MINKFLYYILFLSVSVSITLGAELPNNSGRETAIRLFKTHMLGALHPSLTKDFDALYEKHKEEINVNLSSEEIEKNFNKYGIITLRDNREQSVWSMDVWTVGSPGFVLVIGCGQNLPVCCGSTTRSRDKISHCHKGQETIDRDILTNPSIVTNFELNTENKGLTQYFMDRGFHYNSIVLEGMMPIDFKENNPLLQSFSDLLYPGGLLISTMTNFLSVQEGSVAAKLDSVKDSNEMTSFVVSNWTYRRLLTYVKLFSQYHYQSQIKEGMYDDNFKDLIFNNLFQGKSKEYILQEITNEEISEKLKSILKSYKIESTEMMYPSISLLEHGEHGEGVRFSGLFIMKKQEEI